MEFLLSASRDFIATSFIFCEVFKIGLESLRRRDQESAC